MLPVTMPVGCQVLTLELENTSHLVIPIRLCRSSTPLSRGSLRPLGRLASMLHLQKLTLRLEPVLPIVAIFLISIGHDLLCQVITMFHPRLNVMAILALVL